MPGTDRLVELVTSCGKRELSVEAVRDEVVKDVREFAGACPQSDDLTVVCVEEGGESYLTFL